jgi:type IV fimbrial biogenesis protein FimT
VIKLPKLNFKSYAKPEESTLRKVAGFTLTELMVVLVIVAVIIAVVAPGFSTVILRTKLKTISNQLVGSVYYARGEAIKRNTPVRLCVANNDATDCKGSGTWDDGWIIIDPNELVLQIQEGLPAEMLMVESSGEHTVTFAPSGLSSPAVTLRLCQQSPTSGIEERQLSISTTGRAKQETTRSGCP